MWTFAWVILVVQYYFLFIAIVTDSNGMVLIKNKRDLILMWIPYVAPILWTKHVLKMFILHAIKIYDGLED